MTRTCTKCGKTLPATTEFFYSTSRKSGALQACCKVCWNARCVEYERNNPKARKKETEPQEPEVMCNCFNHEAGKCFELGCRYHMVADRISRRDPQRDVARKIMCAKYTCLFEITSSFPKGLDWNEIGSILGVTDARCIQILEIAFGKIKKRGRHLEDYMVDEVSNRYIKPEPVLGRGKISERKTIPCWNPKIFDQSATVQKH